MKKNNLHTLAVLCAAFCTLTMLRCGLTPMQLTGGSSDTEISGKIVAADAWPTDNTEVSLIPCTFNPAVDPEEQVLKDTTGEPGTYSFTVKTPGQYAIQAVQLKTRTRTLITGIIVAKNSDTIRVADGVLRTPGTLKLLLPGPYDPVNGYVYVPGTTFMAWMAAGYAIIDSVPAGYVPSVYYGSTKDLPVSRVIKTNFTVPPGDTAVFADYGSWSYVKKLFLNATAAGANVAGNVYDYPVLVRLDSGNFDFSMASVDGSDLRFTKSDDTPLSFEIEQWDGAAKKAAVWVRVDTVYGNSDTRFCRMYWGSPASSATASLSSGAAVFGRTSGYAGVWHLGEEAAGVGMPGLYRDATGRNSGDDSITNTDKSGIIGRGQGFNGIGDFIPTNKWVTNFSRGDFSISLWLRPAGEGMAILSKQDRDSLWEFGEDCLYLGDTSRYVATGVKGMQPAFVGYQNEYAVAARSLDLNKWHHLVYTWKWDGNDSGVFRYYIDGEPVSSEIATRRIWNDDSTGTMVNIGKTNYFEARNCFCGSMDELEISSAVRSPDWVRLSYANQKPDGVLVEIR